ncbi:hypothetical protein [Okeania sp. SIO2B3]|uniref:hypothetical protein n=1 Tax=Okeania sp. SIO2B3 TaxID=2607784 RepID=UPI0013C00EA7|nr:hypothetical protein [Okeania sp. SIO2B3]NET46637.1 hypothetical protein [Okeania sp. SIO2B3]
MENNKDNELIYSESDLENAYWEGIKDKTSFLAVIAVVLLLASVVGSFAGKVLPPLMEFTLKQAMSAEEGTHLPGSLPKQSIQAN